MGVAKSQRILTEAVDSPAAIREQVLAGSSVEKRRRLADDFFDVPIDAKVSCKFGGACTSPSRRDQTKRRAWLCGSDYTHSDRLGGCVAYCRFERFLKVKQSANSRFAEK